MIDRRLHHARSAAVAGRAALRPSGRAGEHRFRTRLQGRGRQPRRRRTKFDLSVDAVVRSRARRKGGCHGRSLPGADHRTSRRLLPKCGGSWHWRPSRVRGDRRFGSLLRSPKRPGASLVDPAFSRGRPGELLERHRHSGSGALHERRRRGARPWCSGNSPSAHWKLVVDASVGLARGGGQHRSDAATWRSARACWGCSARAWVCWSSATRRAQRLAKQQMEFVAAVSHELRTPLAVIRSAAENLADGVVHDEARIRRYGELMRAEGRRLTEMVEQILELAGIQSGKRGFALRPVGRGPLLHDIVSASSALIESAGIGGRVRHACRCAAGAGRRAGAAARVSEPDRQRDQVRRRRAGGSA